MGYSQRDPRWRNHPLGYGPLLGTIGDYGCFDTTLAMVATWAGWKTNPAQLDEAMVAHGGIFQKDPTGTFDYLPDDGKSLRELAVAHGDGWKIPPIPASVFAVNAADAAWVDRQCTMHPLSSCEAPAQISGACDGIASIGYILARGYDGPFGQFYVKAGERRWWQEELACGHDVMLDMPNELSALLLQRK